MILEQLPVIKKHDLIKLDLTNKVVVCGLFFGLEENGLVMMHVVASTGSTFDRIVIQIDALEHAEILKRN